MTMTNIRVRPFPSSTKRRLQNSSVTGARINARSALILASTYEGLRPPVHYPQGLTFSGGKDGQGLGSDTKKFWCCWLGENNGSQILQPAP